MSRKKKLLVIISTCLILSLAGFFAVRTAFRFIKDRRAASTEKFFENKINNETDNTTPPASDNNLEVQSPEDEGEPGEYLEDGDKEEEGNEAMEEETDGTKEIFVEIKKTDCDNRCDKFRNDDEDYKYCQEICGLKELSDKDSIKECEDLEGLEEDYCLRDVAVKKLDYAICGKIEDAGIEKLCHNRITEELVDNQEESEN